MGASDRGSSCSSLENVDGLANLTNLTSLDLFDCDALSVLPEEGDNDHAMASHRLPGTY